MNRIKNFFSLLETVFNSKRLRTILGALIFFVGVFGYLFYLAEPDINSYGDGIWLALVTITTVGYGDIELTTTLGRFVASALMFLGLGLIATVTAIISAKFTKNINAPSIVLNLLLLKTVSNKLKKFFIVLKFLLISKNSVFIFYMVRYL